MMVKEQPAVEKAAALVREKTGEKDVAIMDNTWLKRMEEGVIVSLHIRRWGARTGLQFEDLGIPIDASSEREEVEQLLALGALFLMPARFDRKMSSAASAARKYLDRSSTPTSYGAFVPFTEYAEVKAELEKRKAEYLAAAAEIADNMEAIKAEHVIRCRESAHQAYRRLVKLTPRFKTSDKFVDEEAFVENFLDNVVSAIPPTDELRGKYDFMIRVGFIPLPSLLARDLAKTRAIEEKARTDAEIQREKAGAERAVIAAQRDAALEATELARLKTEAAIEDERRAAAERERRLAEMNRDVIEQARADAQATIGQFRDDLQSRLYSLVYENITEIMETNTERKAIHARSREQLNNLVELAGKLNFFGNEDIAKMIGRARDVLGIQAGSESISMDRIMASLKDIAIATRSVLIDLGEQPRSRREFDIPDMPSEPVLRSSRRALGLSEVSVEEVGERKVHRL